MSTTGKFADFLKTGEIAPVLEQKDLVKPEDHSAASKDEEEDKELASLKKRNPSAYYKIVSYQ